MQYTISLSTRMLTIAAFFIVALFFLIFLLGVETGKRFKNPTEIPSSVSSLNKFDHLLPTTSPQEISIGHLIEKSSPIKP